MNGTTGLRDLRISCIVGVHPHERDTPQDVLVDLEFDYDFGAAAASDNVADVVNYDEASQQVIDLVQTRRFQLIETMAESAAAVLLDRHPRVRVVRIEVRKPAAVPGAAGSFARVERSRG